MPIALSAAGSASRHFCSPCESGAVPRAVRSHALSAQQLHGAQPKLVAVAEDPKGLPHSPRRTSSYRLLARTAVEMRRPLQGGSEDAAVLKALEEQLTLEEIAHFRAGVAAVYSRHAPWRRMTRADELASRLTKACSWPSAMLDDPDHLHHALDAVDAVVGNLGPLPTPVASMLFQQEGDVGNVDGAPSLVFSATLGCPKIGVFLAIEGDRNPLTAPLPDRKFSCLEALLGDINYAIAPAGKLCYCSNRRRSCGGGTSGFGPLRLILQVLCCRQHGVDCWYDHCEWAAEREQRREGASTAESLGSCQQNAAGQSCPLHPSLVQRSAIQRSIAGNCSILSEHSLT